MDIRSELVMQYLQQQDSEIIKFALDAAVKHAIIIQQQETMAAMEKQMGQKLEVVKNEPGPSAGSGATGKAKS